jgi:uncharacterized damage-inducible protein DinB
MIAAFVASMLERELRTLRQEVEAARAVVAAALAPLAEADLRRVYPETIGGVEVETGEYLIHLAVHLTYHLGQIDLHRRVVTGRAEAVDAVRPAELSTARRPSAS